MRNSILSAATSAMILAAASLPAAAQTPPAPPPAMSTAAPSAAGSCEPGSVADGTYEVSERQERNNRGERAAREDRPDRENRREARQAAADVEGTAITEVTLTWQCGGTGPGGAFIPAGYKVEVRGECPSGTCDLGTTIAMEGREVGEYAGFLSDETVGFREMRIQARRRAVNLTVRTSIEGQRRPAQARYTLIAKRAS